MAALVEVQGLEAFANQMRKRPIFPEWLREAHPELKELYLSSVGSLDPKVLPQVLRSVKLCDLPAREQIRTLFVPVLILAWVEDAAHPLATAEELDMLLPESQLVIAAGIKDAQGWPERIREFVRSQT
jgi:hypothetical protein